jgi:hypothetical protein
MKTLLTKALLYCCVASTTLTGCAFQNLGTFDETSSETQQTESAEVASSATVGDTITGDDYSITLNSAQFSQADIFSSSPENDEYLILDITVENSSSEDNSLSSLLSFELQGSDAYKYQQALTAEKKGNLDGTVPAGGKLRGQIAFDVPSLDSYTVTYKNSLFSDSVSFQVQSNQIK